MSNFKNFWCVTGQCLWCRWQDSSPLGNLSGTCMRYMSGICVVCFIKTLVFLSCNVKTTTACASSLFCRSLHIKESNFWCSFSKWVILLICVVPELSKVLNPLLWEGFFGMNSSPPLWKLQFTFTLSLTFFWFVKFPYHSPPPHL